MLVLQRQRDESIMIGDNVEISIIDVRGDKVRLGITAPPEIPVHRKEVYEAIKREGGGGYRPGRHNKNPLTNRQTGYLPSELELGAQQIGRLYQQIKILDLKWHQEENDIREKSS